MKATTLFTAAILVAGGAITTSALFASARGSLEPTGVAARTAQETAKATFESLSADYEKAKADFMERLKIANKKERKAIRDSEPITEFWPRFEALAKTGEGRALVWLADNIKTNRDIKLSERTDALLSFYSALAESHVNADWFEGALQSFVRDGSSFGLETATKMVDAMFAKATTDKAKAAALYYGASAVQKEAPEKAKAWMAKVLKEYGDTSFGMMARAAMAKPEDSEVGKIAPEFTASSIDGFEFSLEDYRGKVTVLDFYGFW